MEDGVGTIIYILLTAVALIIAALGKKKRQGTKSPVNPANAKTETDPFSLFEFEEKEPDIEFEEEEVESVEVAPSFTNVLGMTIEEGVSAFSEGAVQTEREEERLRKEMETDSPEYQPTEDLKKPNVDQKGKTDIDSILEEFDLKKAIIFSEIVNNKKF